jgi:hypothetical protein
MAVAGDAAVVGRDGVGNGVYQRLSKKPCSSIIIGIVLFILFPDMMRQVFELYGALIGPLAIIILLVAALPRKNKGRSSKRRSGMK